MHGFLETFWAIVFALFGALAIGALVVGATILTLVLALFGCVWLVLRRRGREDSTKRD